MISIEWYNGLPIKYESFLIERYDSFITTCRYIEINYPTYDINYMIVSENDSMIELIVFGIRNNICLCFNSLVHIDQYIIKEFTTNIFSRYLSVKKVIISASYNCYNLEKTFLIDKTDDYILNLPSTIDEYFSKLGSRTQKNIRFCRNKLYKDYPKVNFTTVFGNDINEDIVTKIIELNINRMKHKGVIPRKNPQDIMNIYEYSKHYGCVVYLEIDGKIVAGNISFILNKRIFGFVIAHDNNFSKYNIGQLCQLHVIQTLIEKGLSDFHFLMGNSEYKVRLLAKPKSLYSYKVFKAYSFSYFIESINAKLSRIISLTRNSKYSQPFRKTIKLFRKKSFQKKTS